MGFQNLGYIFEKLLKGGIFNLLKQLWNMANGYFTTGMSESIFHHENEHVHSGEISMCQWDRLFF